jgi:ABC-2 type transport system ATP-binding protein
MTTPPALESIGLGKRYGADWALAECTTSIPTGTVTALVGPNGAGKSTLLQIAVGLTKPSAGKIAIFGEDPTIHLERVLPRIGFVAQDHPLYRRFSVGEMLTLGRKLNRHWDDGLAKQRLARLNIPLNRPTGKLSGGQQAQVALVLALAKRPELILLDEPLAALDPLARREFLQTLMDAVAATGMTVLLSSHNLAELERVCDYVLVLSGGHVQLDGEVEQIVAAHKFLMGPRSSFSDFADRHDVLQITHTERQTSALVRANGHLYDPEWTVQQISLEEIVLAYLARPAGDERVSFAPLSTEVAA